MWTQLCICVYLSKKIWIIGKKHEGENNSNSTIQRYSSNNRNTV